VDANEQLRRYLEQRRDMGETELVLDSLTVDETLRILGARAEVGGSKSSRAEGTAPREVPAKPSSATSSGDWRETLRASGAESGSADPAHDEVASSAASRISGTQSGSTSPIAASPSSLESLTTIDLLAAHVASCTRCPLYSTATNAVPGEGNPHADFMCVGEAPGATEDQTGRPFIGAAGQLLTKILAAIDLKREDVFICNVLKHRPPGNRNPRPEEVIACSPYLVRQIELIQPKVILALGTFAAQTLLDTKLPISKLRGDVHRYCGVPLVVTYHPAALLRNPSWKRPPWEDVQLARRILESRTTRPSAGA
jgi:uracil-DNA glycosylase family 4